MKINKRTLCAADLRPSCAVRAAKFAGILPFPPQPPVFFVFFRFSKSQAALDFPEQPRDCKKRLPIIFKAGIMIISILLTHVRATPR
ncbi:MAG: hypothetical protein ACI4MP_14300 [Candidatus Ventricola sp.]